MVYLDSTPRFLHSKPRLHIITHSPMIYSCYIPQATTINLYPSSFFTPLRPIMIYSCNASRHHYKPSPYAFSPSPLSPFTSPTILALLIRPWGQKKGSYGERHSRNFIINEVTHLSLSSCRVLRCVMVRGGGRSVVAVAVVVVVTAAAWGSLLTAGAAVVVAGAAHSPCPVSEFTCENLRCVPKDRVCNGKDDCGDKSDEKPNCTRKSCSRCGSCCNSSDGKQQQRK